MPDIVHQIENKHIASVWFSIELTLGRNKQESTTGEKDIFINTISIHIVGTFIRVHAISIDIILLYLNNAQLDPAFSLTRRFFLGILRSPRKKKSRRICCVPVSIFCWPSSTFFRLAWNDTKEQKEESWIPNLWSDNIKLD
jgi:hypothetical protein